MTHENEVARRARREFLRAAGTMGLGSLLSARAVTALAAQSVTLPVANGDRPLAQYPQKRPLILQTSRPPQLETPFEVQHRATLRCPSRHCRAAHRPPWVQKRHDYCLSTG